MAMVKLAQAKKLVAQLVQDNSDKEALGASHLAALPEEAPPILHKNLQELSAIAQERDYSLSVYQLPCNKTPLFVIVLVPDGNDGWFEAYTTTGTLVGAGQFSGSNVAWADVAEVRACAVANTMTESTLPALRQMLVWELQPDGTYQSNCGRFHIQESGGIWSVVELPGDCHSLREAQELAQQVAPYYT